MKVLFDTNIVLDVLLDRKPFSEVASGLFSHVESGDLAGSVCATTITTIHYLATKAVGARMAKEHVEKILQLFEVTPVNRLVLETALAGRVSDFEDGVIVASAHHAGMDAVVTRNVRDFKNSLLPVYGSG